MLQCLRVSDRGSWLWAQASTQLREFAEGVSGMADAVGGSISGPAVQNMQALADDIAAWMGVPDLRPTPAFALPPPPKSLPKSQDT